MFLEKASTEVIADDSMHFQSVVKSFKEYRNHSVYVNNQRKADLPKLSIEHQALLKPYAMKLGIPFDLWIIDSINLCASKNQIFLTEMIKDELSPEVDQQIASGSNVEKVRSTLRQFVRDWAVEGEEERKGCYTPILQALEEEFDDIPVDNRDAIRILVPGAGLGRLAYEIARRNFSCEGNEFSFHCLIASNYIFNKVLEKESVKIYPWIHNLSNHCWTEDMLRAVSFPDVVPTNELQGTTSDFSMTAGRLLSL
jgi:carnosine N-methyltransferase